MATGATEFFGRTEAAGTVGAAEGVFIPEIWSGRVVVARDEKLLLAPTFDTTYADELHFGDNLHVASISHLATRSKGENAAIDFEMTGEALTTIAVTTHKYAAFAVEDIVKIQSRVDLRSKFTREVGYTLALDLDTFCAGFMDDFDTTVGTFATALTDDVILEGIEDLNLANAPMENRYLFIPPTQRTELMKIDKFVHADYSKWAEMSSAGTIGRIYELGVLMSTNVELASTANYDCGIYQKEAVALIVQKTPRVIGWWDGDYLATKVVADQVYGGKEMRGDHGVWVKG